MSALRDKIIMGQIKAHKDLGCVSQVIYQNFFEKTLNESTMTRWAEVEGQLRNKLVTLNPGKPTDGTEDDNGGKVAFSMGGKRIKTRTGRFINKRLGVTGHYSGSFLQKITDQFNAEVFPHIDIRLDKGKKIQDNYADSIGTGSCMTGCRRYTEMYAQNPDKIQQLIMGHLKDSARALVWKLDDGRFYMDRIYSSSYSLYDQMIEYAITKGWLYKNERKSGGDFMNVFFDGKLIKDHREMTVSGIEAIEGGIPYQDTFRKGVIVEEDGDDDNTMYLFDLHHDYYKGDKDCQFISTEGYVEKY